MSLISVKNNNTSINFDEESLKFSIIKSNLEWKWSKNYEPKIVTSKGDTIKFTDATLIKHSIWKTGVGVGIRSSYEGFIIDGKQVPYSFETVVWIEQVSDDIFFELIPINEEGIEICAIYWPGFMEFDNKSKDWYTVLTCAQGVIIPNDWKYEVSKVPFEGQLCSESAYMPWFGQVRPDSGYIAICEQPWDAAYQIEHKADGPYTYIGIRWLPSLGNLNYRRVMKYTFLEKCDYNDLCKLYRGYVKEKGLFTSLAEKTAKNPLVDKLIGSAIVHKGIKTHCSPLSRYYDKENPENNDSLVKFSVRVEEMKLLKSKGLDKVYLHLDGWGEPGYDNKHPDYLPACIEAGGYEGMKELSDTMKDLNYMFGIHDQYRDYYFDAPTFDKDFSCHRSDGTIMDEAIWAGGRQSLLCATQAPYYLKRNFEDLFKHGIQLEATYLDVFTCNEGDECSHYWHRMTRKECFEYRNSCFEYLSSRNILPSSEEVADWSMKSLVFCHYGPYEFMVSKKGEHRKGISVPLFNLVYHDCVILPWLMDHSNDHEDYMLYALLNGGAAYLNFELSTPAEILDEEINRYKIVANLQQKVAKCEMIRHEFIDDDYNKQRAIYSDGTVVEIDLNNQNYKIETK